MTALIITGSLLLLLAVLLFTPVRADISYRDGELKGRLTYLVYRRHFLPEKVAKKTVRKTERQVKKEYEKQEKEADTELDKTKGFIDTVKMVWSLLKASRRGLGILRRHLVFSRVQVYICVGGPDAHQTALTCARLGAAVLAALDVTDTLFVLRKPKVGIAPDFTKAETRSDIGVRVSIRPAFVIAAGVSILYRFLRTSLANKKKRQQIKGGKQHERAASHQ